MDERVMQFRVGVVVVATMIIAALLVTLNSPLPLSWIPWLGGSYEIQVELAEAPGIGPNTPVRKNGLLIGRVSKVEDLDDRVVVTVDLDHGRKVYRQQPYSCEVRTTVLGDSTIEFISGSVPAGSQPLPPGSTVRGRVVSSPFESFADLKDDLEVTINALGRAGDEVATLAERFNRSFGDAAEEGRFRNLPEKLDVALQDFSHLTETMDDFFSGEDLREGLRELPETVREARVAFQDTRRAMANMENVLASADRNMKNLEGLTEPLGRSGDNVAESLIKTVASLDLLVDETLVLIKAVNNREGTIGQLLHNRETHDNLNQLLLNTNYVVVRFNEIVNRLRPVVDDARVFMDKIAREPGRLIGGAVNRGPGIK